MNNRGLRVMLFLGTAAIAAATGFGQTTSGEIEIQGAARTSIGADLDHGTSGMEFDMSSVLLRIKPKLSSGSVKRSGAAGEKYYGEISLTGISIRTEDGLTNYDPSDPFNDWQKINSSAQYPIVAVWDGLSARLVLDRLTIAMRKGATAEVNFEGRKADSYWLANAFDYDVYSGAYGKLTDAQTAALVKTTSTASSQVYFASPGLYHVQEFNYGINAKYSLEGIGEIGLDLASYRSWSDTSRFAEGDQGDNAWAGMLGFGLTAVKELTLNLGGSIGVGYADAYGNADRRPIAFGGKLGWDFKPLARLSATPVLAVDFLAPDPDIAGDAMDFGVTGGIALGLPKSKLTVNAGYGHTGGASPLDAMAYTLALDLKDIPGLILQGVYEVVDPSMTVKDNQTMAAFGRVALGLQIGDRIVLSPSISASWDNKDDATKARKTGDADLYLKAGIALDGLLANASLSLAWNSNDLQQTGVASPDRLGELVLSTSVSF